MSFSDLISGVRNVWANLRVEKLTIDNGIIGELGIEGDVGIVGNLIVTEDVDIGTSIKFNDPLPVDPLNEGRIIGNSSYTYTFSTDSVYPNDIDVTFREIGGLCHMLFTLSPETVTDGTLNFSPPNDFPERFMPSAITKLYTAVEDAGVFELGSVTLIGDGTIEVRAFDNTGDIAFTAGQASVSRCCLSYLSKSFT